MSTITVGFLVSSVEKKIQDEGNDDWSESDLIGLYNLTLREIVSLDPKAYTITSNELMISGVEQTIPTAGIALVDVIRNMGTDGAIAGDMVREIPLSVLDDFYPGWAAETATTAIEHYTRIDGIKNKFYTYPQSDGTGYLELKYSATPTTTTYDTDNVWQSRVIPLDDNYVDSLINGMLYRAYEDDSDLPGNAQRSEMYKTRFMQTLGIQAQKG